MKSRLYQEYKNKVSLELMKELELKNVMQIPKLEKVIISSCVKEATTDVKLLEKNMVELGLITGQKPKMTRSKKAIAAFKLRANIPIGSYVTLRRDRMYEFFDRLVTIALPRVRDFRGIPNTGFDGNGNFTIGLKEQSIFPELVYDQIERPRGMNITVVTTANSDKAGKLLLQKLGMPFRSDSK